MSTSTLDGVGHGASGTNYLNAKKGLMSWLFTIDHKRIGVMYLATVLTFFLTGGFANEHDAGGDAADTEDGLFAATGELRTTLTRRDGVAETAHRRFAVGCRVELSGNGQGDLLQLSGYAYS